MFKLFITLSIVISFNAFAGTEIRNGGAGLNINGGVATFFTAKVNIRPVALKEIPGLNELKQEIRNLVIDPKEKMNLFNFINPTFSRTYYQTTLASEDKEIKKIIQDYKAALSLQSNDELTVFAITNTASQTTLLLPDFFKLTTVEQTAILFHEALWFSPKINSLQQVLVLEYNFQKFLERKDAESTYDFYEALSIIYGQESWLFYATLKKELADYALENPSQKFIKTSNLFSAKAVPSLASYAKANYTDTRMSALSNFQLNSLEGLEDPSPLFYTKKALFFFLNKSIIFGNAYYSFFASPLENDMYCNNYNCEDIFKNGFIPLNNDNDFNIPILNPYTSEKVLLLNLNTSKFR